MQAPDATAVIEAAIAEDLAYGPDYTTLATIDADAHTTAQVRARAEGIICGAVYIEHVLSDASITTVPDGTRVRPGDVVATIEAPTRKLLTAERTFLNLLCHLSGIATVTDQWASALAAVGNTRVRDTRKTTPGLRLLEKYAVRCGGGVNHRLGLGDAALIKDNHIAAAGSVTAAFEKVRAAYPDLACEIEVDNLEQLAEVLPLNPDVVMLDNFTPAEVRQAVEMVASQSVVLEASGGLTLDNAAEYGATGVDFVAVGELTHSARVLDLGLDF